MVYFNEIKQESKHTYIKDSNNNKKKDKLASEVALIESKH